MIQGFHIHIFLKRSDLPGYSRFPEHVPPPHTPACDFSGHRIVNAAFCVFWHSHEIICMCMPMLPLFWCPPMGTEHAPRVLLIRLLRVVSAMLEKDLWPGLDPGTCGSPDDVDVSNSESVDGRQHVACHQMLQTLSGTTTPVHNHLKQCPAILNEFKSRSCECEHLACQLSLVNAVEQKQLLPSQDMTFHHKSCRPRHSVLILCDSHNPHHFLELVKYNKSVIYK